MAQPAERWPPLIGHRGVGAGGLRQRQHGGQADALRAGKAGPLLGAVGVGEDRGFVIGRERALDGAQDSFTSAMMFEGRVWSMTKAMESGSGSTLNTRNGSRVLFS